MQLQAQVYLLLLMLLAMVAKGMKRKHALAFLTTKLHVQKLSGEEVAALHPDELTDVRALKRHLQSFCGLPRFRQRLLHQGTQLEDRDSLQGRTIDLQHVLLCFHEASAEEVAELVRASDVGDAPTVERILLRPQDPNLAEKGTRRLPLQLACANGHIQIVRLLLEASAAPDTGCNGLTPLTVACAGGHMEITRMLLRAGADVNLADRSHGATPLAVASRHGAGSVAMVRLLLEAGARVDGQGINGRTAFWQACFNGREDVARVLLQAGADWQKSDRDGTTPLMKAQRKGHHNIVKLLFACRPPR